MLIVRIADTRRIAAQILLVQAATTMSIALLCLVLWSTTHALSALAGGLIGLIANAYMTFTVLRPTASTGGALGRLMLGQLVKVVATVALFVIVARTGKASWPAVIVAYVATMLVLWLVPLLASPKGRVEVSKLKGTTE
jgi:F0F1-type ATP synthase assembly protein I